MTDEASKSLILGREEFLAARHMFRTEDVEIPDVGLVRVRELSAGDRDDLDTFLQRHRETGSGRGRERAKLLQLAIVDTDGKKLFTAEDLDRIAALPAAVVDRVMPVIDRLSDLGIFTPSPRVVPPPFREDTAG